MAQHALVPMERLPGCESCQRLPAAGALLVTLAKRDPATDQKVEGKRLMMLCAECSLHRIMQRTFDGWKPIAIELVAVIVPVPQVYVKGELAQESELLTYIEKAEQADA